MKRLLNNSLQLKNTAYSLILLITAVVLYKLFVLFPLHWDTTQNASNSLSASSVNTLQQMHGVVKITLYANKKDAEMGDVEQMVRDFVERYQRYKPDIKFTFVDPLDEPEAMKKVEIRSNFEMVVEFAGRSEHLTLVNEQSLTSALLRLAHTKDQKILYLEGHGERQLEGVANHDLGDFGRKLKLNGFQLSSLNLALAQEVPSNANVLLITQPQIALLAGEVDKILRYVDGGGNLLWLLDAEPLHGLERLAAQLGILLSPGIVTDPEAQRINAPSNWALGASYPPHPITRNFNLNTLFPYARALGLEDSSGQADSDARGSKIAWQRNTLVEAASRGWVSRTRTPPSKKARFDKNRDTPGPFSLAIAMQRVINEREQRIVVVGSGAFLANTYVGNGGNVDLGINMVNWLAHEEHLVTTQPRATEDSSITLSRNQLSVISIGFAIVLPLLLLALGGVLWWRRRT